MIKTLGIVQIRREAEKIHCKAARKLGGKSLLELVVRRVTDCQLLARVAAAVDHFHAASIIRVCTDNPFIDPVLVDRLVSTADVHARCDYISYCRGDGRPAILTQLGLLAEWCNAAAVREANRQATRAAERDAVTSYLYAHPERFNIRLIPLPAELDRDDLRLKIDHEEDWEHAQVIYEALGADEWDWQRIADFLDHQPALRHRMAHLNRAKTPV